MTPWKSFSFAALVGPGDANTIADARVQAGGARSESSLSATTADPFRIGASSSASHGHEVQIWLLSTLPTCLLHATHSHVHGYVRALAKLEVKLKDASTSRKRPLGN